MKPASHYINNQWFAGKGPDLVSRDPATGNSLLTVKHGTSDEVDQAFQAAGQALPGWAQLSFSDRLPYLERYRDLINDQKTSLAEAIAQETGKPLWEALQEVGAMVGKLNISVTAYQDRLKELQVSLPGTTGITRFAPLGPVAVLGPFNLPGHLPNGHILPALLSGNTVLFKPSPHTPYVGQLMARTFEQSGLPPGVFNLVQGSRETAEKIIQHPLLAGLYFTGSYAVGRLLHQAFAGQVDKMLVLEMGGNNPLVVDSILDIEAAAYLSVLSAYITSGQRCVCARRLIVPVGKMGDQFIDALIHMINSIQIGSWSDSPEPFMGPVIHSSAADNIKAQVDQLLKQGARSLVPLSVLPTGPNFLSPSLLDVTSLADLPDEEIFGPVLQLIRVPDFATAVKTAKQTRFGLAAGLLSDDPQQYETFRTQMRAGIVNWNRQITGASGAMPFGGVGFSGNYRPSAYFAADYTAYPVASLESSTLSMPEQKCPGISL